MDNDFNSVSNSNELESPPLNTSLDIIEEDNHSNGEKENEIQHIFYKDPNSIEDNEEYTSDDESSEFDHVEGSLKRKRIPRYINSVKPMNKRFKSGQSGKNDIYTRIEILITNLKVDNIKVQQDAANEIRILAQSDQNRIIIAEKQGIKPLIELLKTTKVVGVQRHVAGALWNLGVNVKNNKAIADFGAIEPLVQLLKSTAEKVQRVAAGALRCLAWKHEENREKNCFVSRN